ncbi:MAG: helix-turn-helix domain-containing protein [bacterium]|nr:helix-turn-helix domain-containing protein [bacterium]
MTERIENTMSLTKTLQEYGLKEKHVRVYVACLELGSGSILKISQKAALPRSTTEVILNSLQEKGFVSSFKKKNAKYFSTEDPKRIVAGAKAKAELLEKALPEFREVYARSNIIPTVRFYHGKEGMKTMLREIISDTEAKELIAFSSVDDIFELLGKEFYTFVQKRVKRGLPSRVILRETDKAWERIARGTSELRQVRLIPPSYEHHGLIYVWGNKVAMVSLKHEWVVLIIESAELAQAQKTLFDALWDSLPVPKIT